MSLGNNLQALREKVGLSQSELAQKAKVSVKTLQNWEINRNQPRVDALVKLAQALGVSLETIAAGIGGSGGGKLKPTKRKRRSRPQNAAP
jgi:transcriptional regulator with XRE-family HTH domain